MAVLKIITKAIGKVWAFVTTLILIAVIIAFAFCVAMVIIPDDVLNAIELIKGLIHQGGANCGIWLRSIGIC